MHRQQPLYNDRPTAFSLFFFIKNYSLSSVSFSQPPSLFHAGAITFFCFFSFLLLLSFPPLEEEEDKENWCRASGCDCVSVLFSLVSLGVFWLLLSPARLGNRQTNVGIGCQQPPTLSLSLPFSIILLLLYYQDADIVHIQPRIFVCIGIETVAYWGGLPPLLSFSAGEKDINTSYVLQVCVPPETDHLCL